MIDLQPSPAAAQEEEPPTSPGLRLGARAASWAGAVPFLLFIGLLLVIPAISVVVGAFETDSGGFTLANLRIATEGPYLSSFIASFELSIASTVLAVILGMLAALAIAGTGGRSRALLQSASSVLANTGGVPLAFAFIATLGNFGVVTEVLSSLGFDPYRHGFSLYSVLGLTIVYQYFLVPLMVLIMIGPIRTFKRSWVEAATSLGASRLRFWASVGLPILAPAILSGAVVIFTDAFAAYATAEALTSGTIPLVPIQIGSLVSGNVAAGQGNLGNALGLGMIIVIAAAATIYLASSRRSARWLR